MAIGDVLAFDVREEYLTRKDYREGAPNETTAREDAAMVAGWECPRCGHEGMLYRPFTRIGDERWLARHEYRPHAVCGACGFWEEF